MANNREISFWSRIWPTFLLLSARLAWSVPVMLVALLLSGSAQAAPAGECPKVMANTPSGVAVRISDGCDLFRVVRAYPLIDPQTGRPYPTQIQLRSIFAANQDHYEDGVFVRRSVMRVCARPGKPDAYADDDEKNNVCKNGDGLTYYFGIPGVKILIPSKRHFTPAEEVELTRKQLEAEQAAKDAAAAKRKAEEREERSVEVNAQAAARIDELEKKLDAGNAQISEMRTPAARGRWFWLLLAGILGLAAYGVGSTMVAVRAKQPKPIIASGSFYPDVGVASEILSEENEKLKRSYAEALNNLKTVRNSFEMAQARIAQLEGDVAAQTMLALTRLNEREDAKKECAKLREENSRLKEEGDRLNGMYIRQEAELKDRLRPSFRPPGMESDAELRNKVQDLRESVTSLEQVRTRQAQLLQQANVELDSLRRRVTAMEAIKKAVEFERDQAVEASRTAQARVAKLRLVKPLPDLLSDEDEAPTNVMDIPMVAVSDKLSPETPEGVRHSVPPPPISAEKTDKQALLKEMATLLEDAWNVKRERLGARSTLDSLSQAVAQLRERIETSRDGNEAVALMARLEELEKKTEVMRQTWEALCQREQDMERLVHSNGFDEFMLRRHSWQPDETAADQVVAVAAYKAATNELLSVIAPEDRFVALTDEMGALRRERNHYRDGIHELASVAYADDDADRVLSMAPAEKVRHVVGTLTDMGRQWLMAAKQAAQSVTESGPPATPQTTSDFVRGGTLASRQFATLDLQSLQSLLSAIPSYLVVDAVKSCIREWLYRIMREGERVYTVYTMEDLHELNAFLCSPLVGGLGMDLSTTIGKSVEGHQVQHASDSACRHPSFKTSSQIPGRFPHTVRPGNDGFSLDDVAAGLKRST